MKSGARNSLWHAVVENHKKKVLYVLPVVTFFIGLVMPSPFAENIRAIIGDEKQCDLVDTVKMVLPDGSVYDGTIMASNGKRHGFGCLTTPDGSVYEGNWKNGTLPFGQRTTTSSVYNGRFDRDLNNEGFGIIRYSKSYIEGKRKQGLLENEIVAVYIGNWHVNNKNGLGRSIKVDGSMDFGTYVKGIFQKTDGANYRVGGSVYGIDVSHHQSNINWDELCLFCDENGKVYNGKPKAKKYMQPVFFAYIKATEGATIRDETYSVRTVEAERHGLAKGAYHFLHLGSDIEEQVKNFLETVSWTKGDLPPALDIEVEQEIKKYGKAKLIDMTLHWLERVEAHMHVRPIVYTRENIRNKYLNDGRLKKYDFWIARYNELGPSNFDWHFWQISEKGILNGYNDGRVDVDLFKGDYAAFNKYRNAEEGL